MSRLVVILLPLLCLSPLELARAQSPAPTPAPTPSDGGDEQEGDEGADELELKIKKAVFEARAEILNQLLDENFKVTDWAERGDLHKSNEEYLQAAVHYAVALRLNPKLHDVAYQLACTFALWGYEDLALDWLEKAVERGFWGYPVMSEDEDLASLKKNERYLKALEAVKARYATDKSKHEGKLVLALPKGEPPAKGWPVVIVLHGWGDDAESYKSLVDEVASHGQAGLAIPGAVPQMEDSYRWPTDSFATTHAYLQKRLAEARKGAKLDPTRVTLLGFSQGALHAVGLLAENPNHYRAALAVSPGGRLEPPKALRGATARRLALLWGKEEPEGNHELVATCKKLWEDAKQPVQAEEHAGGHHFPDDFAQRLPKLLEWLGKE